MLTREQILRLLQTAKLDELQRIANSLSEDVEDELLPLLNKKIDELKKQSVMNKIRQAITDHDTDLKTWLAFAIPLLYVSGFNSANDDAKRLGVALTGSLSYKHITVELLKNNQDFRPHLEAVNALLKDSYLDFANGMNGVVRGAERLLNEALREQVRMQIADGVLTGQSIRTIANNVKDTIGQQGFTALIDRGGRQWEIGDYSEMLARTHLIKANAEGVINRALEHGIDLVRVSSHGATDDLCSPEEGKIYSISGKSDEYPRLDNAPPFHPNCKHTLELIIDTPDN